MSISILTYLDDFQKVISRRWLLLGIAIESGKVDEIREALSIIMGGSAFKWESAYQDIPKAKKIFRLMVKRQLTADVLVIQKTQPKWDEYLKEGEKLYQTGVTKAQEAVPYAKPLETLRQDLYARAIGRLTGLHLRHYKKPLLSSRVVEPFTIQINVICDSDFQGRNKEVFQQIIENMRNLPQTREAFNILPTFDVDIKAEEDEPLLLLPDFLAGYEYSKVTYGEGTENTWHELLMAIKPIYSQWSGHSLVSDQKPYELDYPISQNTFDRVMPRKDREKLLSSVQDMVDTELEAPREL